MQEFFQEFAQDYMFVFWIAAMAIFILLEGLTVQMVALWFALGAVAATFASISGMDLIGQLFVFIIVSGISLAIGKPLVQKHLKSKAVPTNADRCVGQEALVIQDIDNIRQTGQVKIKGAVWTARTLGGEFIKQDSIVIVDSIDGVKLMVHQK